MGAASCLAPRALSPPSDSSLLPSIVNARPGPFSGKARRAQLEPSIDHPRCHYELPACFAATTADTPMQHYVHSNTQRRPGELQNALNALFLVHGCFEYTGLRPPWPPAGSSGRGPTTALCGGGGSPMPCPGVGVVGVVCTGQRRASARSCSPLAFLILACVLSHLYPALRLGRWVLRRARGQ